MFDAPPKPPPDGDEPVAAPPEPPPDDDEPVAAPPKPPSDELLRMAIVPVQPATATSPSAVSPAQRVVFIGVPWPLERGSAQLAMGVPARPAQGRGDGGEHLAPLAGAGGSTGARHQRLDGGKVPPFPTRHEERPTRC